MDVSRWISRASMRLRALFRGAALDAELDEELGFHLEQLIEEKIARGLSPDAARREAILAIGGLEQRKEECRDARRVRVIEDVFQDVRYAARTLSRSPGFTIAALLTLALGIGATVAMFTVVYGVLLRPLPFPDPDRLFLVALSPKSFLMRQPGMADRTYVQFRESDRSFQHLAAFTWYKGNLTGAGDPVVIRVGSVTTEFFDALAVKPAMGRTFLPGDGRGGERMVVMSDQLWRSRFAADPAIVGKDLTLNRLRHSVIGVMPPGFDFPNRTAAWTPHEIVIDPGNSLLVPVLGRLDPDVTVAQARAAFEAAIESVPDVPRDDRSQWDIGLLPLKELLVGDVRRPLQMFAGAVVFVLLIACANVANLLLARASGRDREIAIRAALGASRARLVRQLLTESVLLSVIGAALGVLLAHWAVPLLLALAPAGRIPRGEMIRIDVAVVAFAAGVAAIAGIVFGLTPALRLTRRRFSRTLLPGGRSIAGGHERFRAALVIGEIALALVLLTGAGLLAKSFLRLRAVDPGFRTENVVRLSIELPDSTYSTPGRLQTFHQEMLSRLASLPGVVAVGAVNWLPLGDMHLNGDFRVEGAGEDAPFNVDKTVASPGYFRAMGIRLLQGREFDMHDTGTGPPVVIVSRSVARAIDPSGNVLGKRIGLWGRENSREWLTVVGVVDDVRQLGPSQKSHAAAYQPYLQMSRNLFLSNMTYVVRTVSDPLAAIPAIRNVLSSVDKDQPAASIGLMRDVLDSATAEPGFYARLLGTFAALAVLLALIGAYGVVAYSVAQRSHEIGLRRALGAQDRGILWMVIRRVVSLGAAGVVLGAIIAWLASRLLETFLFEVTPTDPATFIAVALTVFAAAVLAGVIPARRAARVDPLVALRHE
ncbi:MAG TPA: ABC transporter permease [Vicinamibacterales bacterium]|nr:ABC transporter permease [Vicinamibacterales bacterium]